jgi:hypothetical protein
VEATKLNKCLFVQHENAFKAYALKFIAAFFHYLNEMELELVKSDNLVRVYHHCNINVGNLKLGLIEDVNCNYALTNDHFTKSSIFNKCFATVFIVRYSFCG